MSSKTRRSTTTPERALPTRDDVLLTRKEAAELLGVTERWVQRAIARGDFPHVKVGKLVRVSRTDLLVYIAEQRKVG
jgi:excisionase family DNA binding protein